ncbi:MAG TPA: ATP-binding protein [Gemmatimonadales bacterium]
MIILADVASPISMRMLKLVGPLAQWASSILLLCVFALLIPLTSQRRAVVTWMLAWAAQIVATTAPALTILHLVIWPDAARPFSLTFLTPFYWAANFTFLTSVTLGSVAAAGLRLRSRVHFSIIGMAALVGLVIWLRDLDDTGLIVQLFATIVLFFGSVQYILWHAVGIRRVGLSVLALALTGLGALSTIYLCATLNVGSPAGFGRFAQVVALSSGYGDTIAMALLAAAVVVVIVQEGFLDAAKAQEQRIQTVAASESRLNGIIQAAQEAIITVSHDGQIELLNSAALEMFGLQRATALGSKLTDFVSESKVSLADLIADRPVADAADFGTWEGRGRRTDGRVISLEFTVGRLQGEGRSGAVVVLHDTTQRNAALSEREAFEHRMAESEKMLAIGRVVSGVAHELNNPLAVVLGQSEQLVTDAESTEQRNGLNLIHEQAHRARHIVKDLLAFVRHRDDERASIDLGRLTDSTVASQSERAAHCGVTIELDMPAELPLVFADRVAVEQVIVNLVDNALDAAGRGGRVMLIAQVAGAMVELVVVDTGAGVADAIAERVFEPFFTTKAPGHGTGLGLSVSRALATQQGGSLTLDPASSGRGARFVLALPVAITTDAAAVALPPPGFPLPSARPAGSAAEVMLIDDEPSVRVTLSRLFRRHGWLVREAEDGDDALAWLESVPIAEAPAVILCDLKMPRLGGRELFEALAQRRPELAARFIFVTGDVVESMSNGFIAASGRLVVEKPFTIDEIVKAVTMQLQHGA